MEGNRCACLVELSVDCLLLHLSGMEEVEHLLIVALNETKGDGEIPIEWSGRVSVLVLPRNYHCLLSSKQRTFGNEAWESTTHSLDHISDNLIVALPCMLYKTTVFE